MSRRVCDCEHGHEGESALHLALRRLRPARPEESGKPLAVALLGHAAEMRRHAEAVEALLLGALAMAMAEGMSLDEVRAAAFTVGVNPDELPPTLTEAVRHLLKRADLSHLLLCLGRDYPHVLDFVL